MNTRYLIWVFVAIVAGAIMFANARMQFKSAQSKMEKQYIEEASITVTAPKLEKKTVNEKQIKEKQKDFVEYVAIYGTFYKKTEYSMIYTLYKNDFSIEAAAQNVINLFADKSFNKNVLNSAEGTDEKINIDGTFEINGKKFGVEALLIKRALNFWQLISVFPYSDANKDLAKNYVNSAAIDAVISHKAEKNK